jgi:4-amino-4-deoxy-L-arabinose transferase-like glycosyltransferase
MIPLRPSSGSQRNLTLVVLGYYLALMLLGLGDLRALTRHEVFAAQPAREALAGGPWLIQSFGQVPRYEKPPGMSWLIAASFSAFGQSEWAARLPAVLAGAIVVLLVTRYTFRHFGTEAAVIAGLMQSTFFYSVMQFRLAEVDTPLLAATSVGLYAWFRSLDGPQADRHRTALAWTFALALGLAGFLKGPVGPLLMLPGPILHALLTRSKIHAAFLVHPARLALALALGSAWYVAAYVADPNIANQWHNELNIVQGEIKDRAEPFHYYLWNIPLVLLPWVLLAIPAFISARRNGVLHDYRLKAVACLVLTGLVVLSLSAVKSKHYALPLLPALTPILALGLLAYLRHQYSRPPRGYPLLLSLGCIAGIGGISAILLRAPEHSLNLAITAGILVAGSLAVIVLEWRRRRTAQLVAIFSTAFATIAAINLLITPVFDTFHVHRDFARRAAALVPGGQTIATLNLGMAQLTYYLPLPTLRVSSRSTRVPEEISYLIIAADDLPSIPTLTSRLPTELLRLSPTGRSKRPRRDDHLILIRLSAPLAPPTTHGSNTPQ